MFCKAPPEIQSLSIAQKSLLSGPPPKDGGCWTTNTRGSKLTSDTANRFIGRSFAGTNATKGEPLFDWLLSHFEGISGEEKEELVRFVVTAEAQKGSSAVFAKQLHSSDSEVTPSYSAMALIKLYDTDREAGGLTNLLRPVLEAWSFLRLGIIKGFPKAMKDDRWKQARKGIFKVLDEMGESFISNHHTIMKGKIHWYVNFVATEPLQQGRGQGSQLMTRISELADEVGMDCYLEATNEKNKSFYQKFGYEVMGSHSFHKPDEWKDQLQTEPSVTDFFMVRRAKHEA